MNNRSQMLVAMGAGAALGAAMGILCAPCAATAAREGQVSSYEPVKNVPVDSNGKICLQDLIDMVDGKLRHINKELEEMSY